MTESSIDPRIVLAHDMATGQLAAQKTSIDELRARVGVALSGAVVATGFLAGQSLSPSRGLPASGWVGIGGAAAVLLGSVLLLLPRTWSGFEEDARKILADVAAVPDRDYAAFLSQLTDYAAAAVARNSPRIDRLYQLFAGVLAALLVDFGGWIALLTIH